MNLHPFQVDVNRNVWRGFLRGASSGLTQAATGSGKTVMACHLAKMMREHGNKSTLFVAHRREIVNKTADTMQTFGLEPEIVMAGCAPNPWGNVMVGSRDTISSRMKRKHRIKPFDFLIIDEAHLVGRGTRYEALAKEHVSRGGKLLLLTATPIRMDGYGLGNVAQFMVRAPDVPWLVKNGFLCKPRYANLPTEGMLVGDVVRNWKQHGVGRPTMVFAGRVAESLGVVKAFQEAGISAAHVDGDTDKEIRDHIFERSRNGEFQIISNAEVYIEGVDCPWISCVVLATKTNSLPRYMQMAGRMMRTFPGKPDGMLIDHGGHFDRFGPIDIDREWELSSDNKSQERMEAKRKKIEQLSVVCPGCGFRHSSKVCPICNAHPREARNLKFMDAMLKEVTVADWEARLHRKPVSQRSSNKESHEFYSNLIKSRERMQA